MSALDALTPEQYAEVVEEVEMRRLRRALLHAPFTALLEAELTRTIVVPSPAAGTDWTLTMSSGSNWIVRSIQARLVTSAVVANRIPALQVTDGNVLWLRVPPPALSTASQTAFQSWLSGYGATAAFNSNTGFAAPFPDYVLPGGGQIASATVNIDVGDQWSQIFVTVVDLNPGRVIHACDSLLADLDSAGGIHYP